MTAQQDPVLAPLKVIYLAAQHHQRALVAGWHVLENIEVTPPDADGDMWLRIRGDGAIGRVSVNLGKAHLVVARVAWLWEQDRKAALTALATQPPEPKPPQIVINPLWAGMEWAADLPDGTHVIVQRRLPASSPAPGQYGSAEAALSTTKD